MSEAAISNADKPKPLRVAMWTPWRVRCGISDYSRHLVEALRVRPEDVAELRIVEPPAEAAPAGTGAALRRYLAEERRYGRLGAQLNHTADAPADVAHIQHQYFFFGGVAPHKNHAAALLRAVRVPLVMTVHEIAAPSEGASPLLRAALARTNRANLLDPRIRRLLVHTEADRAALCDLGVASSRIQVVTHGVPAVPQMPDREEARRALGVAGRHVLTLFGFLSTKKGHDVALAALRHLPEDALLLLAGDRHPDDHTDYVPSLRARIEAQGLGVRVRITGYLPVDQIPVVMAATDVALAPYLQSSGSGSLANLLAHGRAVVASDIPPHREIARETPACLALFPTGQAGALAAQISELLSAPVRRDALQAAALAYAARHTYADMARETAAIYREAVGSGQ
jgi:glycosyltransferase involved in cell wall biosynthesis